MFSTKKSQNNTQKSPKQRFLFVLGLVFFLMYFILGMMIIFWKELPIALSWSGRLIMGILLIAYSFFRFVRLLQNNREA
ncbi:MAG: hypothetical protein EOO45_03235 [Flavobacterium sp.]|nr:MAG: hypothetical protein EOO45_03235 [Flavobacterium sp.]